MKKTGLFLALLLAASTAASAQARPRFRPEQRIRVSMRTPARGTSVKAATVLADEGDSLFLQISGMQRYVPLASVTRLEVSEGRGSRRRWLVRGALIGGATSTAGALALHQLKRQTIPLPFTPCPADTPLDECPMSRNVPYPYSHYAPIVVTGTVLGAAIGALFPGDRWRQVPVRATTAMLGGRPALALSLRR